MYAAFPVEVKEFVDGVALRGVRDQERVFHLHWTAPIIAYARDRAGGADPT